MNESAAQLELHDLCLSCGFCCDGTLFECVELDPGEEATFDAVTLIRVGAKVAMPLPCNKHCSGTCTVYDRRPTTCSEFTCKLYDGVAAGSVNPQQADERISDARELCRQLENLLGWPARSFSTSAFRRWVREFPGGETEARRAYPQAFLKYGLLRVSLNRHFITSAAK
jgi:hypothetical protein